MANKRIPIDPDLWESASEYAHKQIATMRKFGDQPNLSEEQLDTLIYKCAEYPQVVRNLTAKLEKKAQKRKHAE